MTNGWSASSGSSGPVRSRSAWSRSARHAVGSAGAEVIATGPDQVLVAEQVEIGPIDDEPVAGRLGQQHRGRVPRPPIGFEHVAQPGDVGLEGAEAGRRLAVPQQVDEAISGHHPVGLEQQQGQHGPLLGRARLDASVAVGDPDPPEDLELHRPVSPSPRGGRLSVGERPTGPGSPRHPTRDPGSDRPIVAWPPRPRVRPTVSRSRGASVGSTGAHPEDP